MSAPERETDTIAVLGDSVMTSDEVSRAFGMIVAAMVLVEMSTPDQAAQDIINKTLAACATRFPGLCPLITEAYVVVTRATSSAD